MTYLELVRATLRDGSFGSADDISSIADVGGYEATIRGFVDQAWLKIQQGQNWNYNRLDIEIALVAGKREYAPADMEQSDGTPSIPSYPVVPAENPVPAADGVRRWIFIERDGLSAWSLSDLDRGDYGGFFPYTEFAEFRRTYLTRPEGITAQSKPLRFTVRDREPKPIVVFPTPDKDDTYILYGQCQRQSQILVNDGDEPSGLPVEYHDMIKWRAIMIANNYDQDVDAFQFAKNEYTEIHKDAVGDLTPRWRLGESLAGVSRTTTSGRNSGSFGAL